MPDLEALVEDLAADPLYQLSTAGQELFHSNMLFWLASQRPGQSAPVWHLFDVDAPLKDGPDSAGPIRREWHNIDLYLDSGMAGRKLVLENKVLAIATASQLDGYRSKLLAMDGRVAYADPVTSWRILTLLPLTFDPPAPWRQVTYAELVGPLEKTVEALATDPATTDDAVLVRGYARLVRRLVALTDAVDIAKRLHEQFLISADLAAQLRGARLSALVQKMRTARCATLLTHQLQREHPSVAIPPVKADLTRGDALLEAFVPGPGGRQFGWQVQGTQVRLAMLTGPTTDTPTVSGRDEAAEGFADYFAFDDLPADLAGLLSPYPGRKPWLGYGHEFVYRYRPLRQDATWQQLIDLTAYLTTRAIAYTSAS